MDRQPMRPLVVIAVALVLIISVLVAGGLAVRNYVRTSFLSEEQARAARALAFMSLRIQIDEETGIRGFAATRDRLFLEPYDRGRVDLSTTLPLLRSAVNNMHLDNARTAVDDALATNARWEHDIATPLLADRRDRDRILGRGKGLVDQYRTDIQLIQTAIVNEEARIDVETQAAIDRIGLLVVGAVLAVALLGLGFGIQQSRLSGRLSLRARETAEMRAAYEAEKRVVDTLQEAFVFKTLPALSGVTFSATYLPAADEAKVGGDWYDCVQLSRDRVLFVIGDVAGHGLDAAVAMNHTRQEVISAAVFDAEPGDLLLRVNAELLRQRARMVTV
ncbi:MAG TPA: CHASE3 domain-containing protein, partial [Candidatus Elarobacter sp.]|nr:CHASE3 domain-containing protein [Candidatus Elarobacter sp.]